MADEREELYSVEPGSFTALRTRLAEAAKRRGDPAMAKRISAARKPTVAAWIINRLALGDADVTQRLTDLGERLRAAHAAMDGQRIPELSAQQRTLVDELARAGFRAAEVTDPSAGLRDDVTDTLQAATPTLTSRHGWADWPKPNSGRVSASSAIPRPCLARGLLRGPRQSVGRSRPPSTSLTGVVVTTISSDGKHARRWLTLRMPGRRPSRRSKTGRPS
jgi:hypothetical protein